MASFTTIPVELVIEIVNNLLDEDLSLPVVGQDAALFVPPVSQIQWRFKPNLKKIIKESVPWISSRNSDAFTRSERATPVRRPLCSLKMLRLTSRGFDEICQPFLYRELNLLSDLNPKQWRKMKQILTLPKWSLVQFVSVYMDPHTPLGPDHFADQATSVAAILAQCKNITSLAQYYRDSKVQMMQIYEVLLSLLDAGRLSTLGFYDYRMVKDRNSFTLHFEEPKGFVDLIEAIALSAQAQRSLRVLEVAAMRIPVRIFDLIRSNFVSLTTLSLYRILEAPLFNSMIWDVDQRHKWHPYRNLTRLQLVQVDSAHPSHIPPLVRHFPALKELKISACGGIRSAMTNWRPVGWSHNKDALCNTHCTLASFHIEHMEDWEIYELGVIPTSTLIVTNFTWKHLLSTFGRDREIFPGLQGIKLSPRWLHVLGIPNSTASENEVDEKNRCKLFAILEKLASNTTNQRGTGRAYAGGTELLDAGLHGVTVLDLSMLSDSSMFQMSRGFFS